ncbi:hypothetical protein FRC07_013442, partial [Ceratobasidium sp. 392]
MSHEKRLPTARASANSFSKPRIKMEVVMPEWRKSPTPLKPLSRETSEAKSRLRIDKSRDQVTAQSPSELSPHLKSGKTRLTSPDSSGDHSSDLDYSPGTKYSNAPKKVPQKRQREPSPASSASSISLGSTWYDTTKRRVICKPEYDATRPQNETRTEVAIKKGKGKAGAYSHPNNTRVKSLSTQIDSNLLPYSSPSNPLSAYNDSGYFSGSVNESSTPSHSEGGPDRHLPPAVKLVEDPQVGEGASTSDEGSTRLSSDASSIPGDSEEDNYVETMVDLQPDDQPMADLGRITQESLGAILTPSSSSSRQSATTPFVQSTSSPSSEEHSRTSLSEAGSSTAPGTKEWYQAELSRARYLNHEGLRTSSPEHVRGASAGKQVTFATDPDRMGSTTPEYPS